MDYQPNYHPLLNKIKALSTIINHYLPLSTIMHHDFSHDFSNYQPMMIQTEIIHGPPGRAIEALEFLIQFVVQIAEAALDQTVGDPDLLLASGQNAAGFHKVDSIYVYINYN